MQDALLQLFNPFVWLFIIVAKFGNFILAFSQLLRHFLNTFLFYLKSLVQLINLVVFLPQLFFQLYDHHTFLHYYGLLLADVLLGLLTSTCDEFSAFAWSRLSFLYNLVFE